MESERRRRVLTRRKPLSDCTNSITFSSSSSSSSVPFKPSSSSSIQKSATTKFAPAANVPTNLDNSSNPSSPPPPPTQSSPSSPKTSYLHGTIDVEASVPISVSYSRRHASNKRKGKEKAVALPASVNASNKRKGKEKAVAFPTSVTPSLKITNDWEKSDGVERVNLPKAKAKTVPCRKKHRPVSSEVLKDPQLEDYIKKQNAYFKMIDEFELLEEEVESVDEEKVESVDELD